MLSTHINAVSTELVAVVCVPCPRARCSAGRAGFGAPGGRSAAAVAERVEPRHRCRTKLIARNSHDAKGRWSGQSLRARWALPARTWTRRPGDGRRPATRTAANVRCPGRRPGRTVGRNGRAVDPAGRRSGHGRGARRRSTAALRRAAWFAFARQRLGQSNARWHRRRRAGTWRVDARDQPRRPGPAGGRRTAEQAARRGGR